MKTQIVLLFLLLSACEARRWDMLGAPHPATIDAERIDCFEKGGIEFSAGIINSLPAFNCKWKKK